MESGKNKKKIIIISLVAAAVLIAAVILILILTNANRNAQPEESTSAKDGTESRTGEVTKEESPDVTGLDVDKDGAEYTTAAPEYNYEAYTAIGGSKVEELDFPSADESMLIRVDQYNPLPDNFGVYLTDISVIAEGKYVATQCQNELTEMILDCKNAGCSPYIVNGFLTGDELKKEFEKTRMELLWLGYTKGEAEAIAVKLVGRNGSSEYETGLIVDIVDEYEQTKGTEQQDTPTTQWLNEHCYTYGFIPRFPYGKQNTTGVPYISWHYRYVGRAAAKIIKDSKFCLEEFFTYLSQAEPPETTAVTTAPEETTVEETTAEETEETTDVED